MRARRFRPFRLGLWLGVIGAAIWFVQRYQRSHDLTSPAAPVPQPARPASPSPVRPSVPIVRPEVVEVGDLDRPGEPEVGTVEVAPPPAEAPAKKPTPVKKAAKKKPPAAKKAPAKKADEPQQVPATWVSPDEQGICPTTHPVKAKLSSKLFHLPGMFAYDRTRPDRCYSDEATAVADGLQKAKR